MSERMVDVGGGAQVCVETIGPEDAPAIVLIGGAAWSKDWWADELCGRLADRGRLVIRFDTRDTGRSTAYPPGEPGYAAADLVADVLAILDALGLEKAHVAGLSMGGGLALLLGLDHRDRVASLTLMSTSAVGPGDDELPGMTDALRAAMADEPPPPDWTDRDAVIDHIVEGERAYAGPGSFDEATMRTTAASVVDRSRDVAASLANHFLIDSGGPLRPRLAELAGVPTLVLHGTADPLFPIEHGRALADEIPGARLVELDGVGHQLPPPRCWDLVVDDLVSHTG